MHGRTLFTALVIAAAVPLIRCSGPDTDGAAPPFSPPDSLALREILADAPAHAPVLPFIKKELVDFVDLTGAAPARTVLDDGRSRVTADSCGQYRATGRAQGSFFCLRVHTPAYNKPHIIVIGYPDNADRDMAFGILEQGMQPGCGTDHHIETGITTGSGHPLSNRMQYHAFFLWPQDQWPMLYCANLGNRNPAGAARIWVYRVTAPLPPLDINEPDSILFRRIGPYVGNYETAMSYYGRGPGRRRFFMDYLNMLGCNTLAVATAGSTGVTCSTGYFGEGADGFDTLLNLCERNRIGITAVFAPAAGALPPQGNTGAAPAVQWRDALMDFIMTYGTSSAFRGIALGGPQTVAGNDPATDEAQRLLHDALADKGYPVPQYVFLNAGTVQTQPPVAAWEQGRQPFGYYLAAREAAAFKTHGFSPNNYWYREGICPVRIWHVPAGAGTGPYPGAAADRFISAAVPLKTVPDGAPAAACVILPTVKYPLCLRPERNHAWYARSCIAPQLPGAHRNYLKHLAVPLARADTDVMFIGGSLPALSGGEAYLRQFIRAYRSLPARRFKTVNGAGEPVVARILYRRGRTYFYFINTLPEPVTVTVRIGDFKNISYWVTEHPFNIKNNVLRITLEPYELAAFHANGGFDLRNITCTLPATVTERIRTKLTRYKTLLNEARQQGITLPKRYRALLNEADRAFRQRKLMAADRLLAASIMDAVRLRLEQGPGKTVHVCPRMENEIRLDGRLTDWSGLPSTRSVKREEQLAPGGYAPNHWSGTDDYRADFRLAHRRGMLYFAAEITDDAVRMGEEIHVHLTRNAHRGTADTLKYDYTETIYCAPMDADTLVLDLRGGGRSFTRRTAAGYVVEARIPLAACGIPDTAKTLGCMLTFRDEDEPAARNACGTTMPDNLFIWPASAGRYPSLADPRGALELQLQD